MHSASVIVVSNRRPDALLRCLAGLAQIDHPQCEVIVVADALSRPAIAGSGLAAVVKVVDCETPNIAAARNAGLAQAAGDVVAFIDDDAVPEPRWLSHLTAPFADPKIAATGGFVRGRNGISFQWKARIAFADGEATPIAVDAVRPTVMAGGPGRGLKTEGTNMAFRREALIAMGGFDEAYAFYLDETDVNLRLAQAGALTAIVPLAEVHHGFAPSVRRRGDRVPRNLYQVGASLAVFRRKHDQSTRPTPSIARAAQRRRLLLHMMAGRLMPGDVPRLLRTFDAGWVDGMSRQIGQYPAFSPPPPFLRFPTELRPHIQRRARFWQRRQARRDAARDIENGAVVTLFLMSFTALYHRVRFTEQHIWEQSGGQLGRSDRAGPLVQFWRAGARVRAEMERVAKQRIPAADQTQ